MKHCPNCLFYDPAYDEMRRGGLDIAKVGEETPDDHFCLTYAPIPGGYFEGQKQCPRFVEMKNERG